MAVVENARVATFRWQRDALLVAVGALMLTWPAALNRFPLIFHDTNSYVQFLVETYRSIFYKLFVAASGLHWTIWGTPIAQALIASALILIFLRLFGFGRTLPFLAVMVCLAAISSLPMFAMFVMPDVFTGLMFLTLFMLIFLFDRMTLILRLLLFALLFLFIASHLSHLVLALAIIAACTVGLWLWAPEAPRVGIALAFGASTAVAAALMLYNGMENRSYSASPAGSVFLMANLIEYGPVRRELAEYCPQSGYRLCAYQDRLPPTANNFLWGKTSPFETELGGFDGMREEAAALVRDTLRHQTGAVLSVTLNNGARALFTLDPTAEIIRMEASVDLLRRVFRNQFGWDTVHHFEASLQERNRFPRAPVAALNYAGLILALVTVAVLAGGRFRPRDWRIWVFPAFVFVAYIGNAMLCAAASGVFDRYQARMSWLIPLAALLLILEWLAGRRLAAGVH